MQNNWINGLWSDTDYINLKRKNFEILDKFLTHPPSSILDIGCGLAWEARWFNEKYGTELWLIDGDASDNDKKLKNASEIRYHETADTMLFYNSLSSLDNELKKYGTTNYKLIDCNNIVIPENKKFDLITSWLSCGFHYPANTYKDLIINHSSIQTKIIFDMRVHLKTKKIIDKNVQVINLLNQESKYISAEIKFL